MLIFLIGIFISLVVIFAIIYGYLNIRDNNIKEYGRFCDNPKCKFYERSAKKITNINKVKCNSIILKGKLGHLCDDCKFLMDFLEKWA
jgi:hypothetical protein